MPSREYYLKGRDDKALKSYEKFSYTLAVMLGADPAKAKEEIGKMIELEIELAKVSIVK
jgi:DNA-binding SARP family transcriptional activator